MATAAKKPAASEAKTSKATTKTPVAKSAATKAPAAKKPAAKAATGTGFSKPMTPSKELAAVIGSTPMPRTEVTKKIWEYIKKHNLQDQANKRNINADDKLKPIFGKAQVTMFEMTALVSKHISG